MSYIVTYRTKAGQLERLTLEAATRSDVFKELDARGIKPVSVAEASAKEAKKVVARRSGGASGLFRGLIAAIIVVIGAVAAFLILTREKPVEVAKEAGVEKRRGQMAEVTPAVAVKRPVAKKVDPVEETKKRNEARRKMLKAMTPEERLDFLYKEAEQKPINLEPSSNRTFATGTEQVMGWIFNTTPGDMPPILLKIPIFEEAHLTEILFNKNEIKEGDDEKIIELKENVALAKKEMIKFIKEGGMPDEFLEYYRNVLRDAHMEFQNSQQEVFKMVKEDPEGAAAYLEMVNARLAEKGIKQVKIPPKMAEKFGVVLETADE